jgi:hypothetical protein
MVNLLKVVFLGLVAFGLLVYFTAEKPKQIMANDNVVNLIKLESLPETYELVGKKDIISRENLFKNNSETLILVGNHDSLAVIKDFQKLFNINKNIVLVANISSAPWFVKKMFIPSKLEELNKDSKLPMIYDSDGNMVNALNVSDNSKTRFYAYLLSKEGFITKIYEGIVKQGAIDGSMNDDEKKKVLEPLAKLSK